MLFECALFVLVHFVHFPVSRSNCVFTPTERLLQPKFSSNQRRPPIIGTDYLLRCFFVKDKPFNFSSLTINGISLNTLPQIAIRCLRMRCECDKALAEKLQTYESDWRPGSHFLFTVVCKKRRPT